MQSPSVNGFISALMVGHCSRRNAPQRLVFVCLVIHAAISAIVSVSMLDGSLHDGILLVLLPLIGLLLVKWPITILYIYAFNVPLENLMHINGIGTIEKVLGAMGAAISLWVLRSSRKGKLFSRARIAWCIFLAWMALSLLWAFDPMADGVINLVQVGCLFAFYAILASLRLSKSELDRFVTSSMLGGVVASVFSIALYCHADHSSATWSRLVVQGSGNSIDPNHLAASLQMPIALSLGALLGNARGAKKMLIASAIGLMVIALLMGASRGGLLSIIVASVFISFRSRKLGPLIVCTMLLGLCSLLLPSVWSRFADPSQGDGSGRLEIWEVGLRAFSEHPIAGVGVGNFQVAYNQYLLQVYQREFQGWFIPSNSQFICAATELGLVGTLFLVVALISQFRQIKSIPIGSSYGPLKIGLEAGMLALATESFFIDTLWYKYLWLGFILVEIVGTNDRWSDLNSRVNQSSRLAIAGNPGEAIHGCLLPSRNSPVSLTNLYGRKET